MLHARVSRTNPASSFSAAVLGWRLCSSNGLKSSRAVGTIKGCVWVCFCQRKHTRAALKREQGELNSGCNQIIIYGCFSWNSPSHRYRTSIPAAVWNKQLYMIYKMYFHDNSWKTFHQFKSSQQPVWTSSPNFTAIHPKRVKKLKLNRNRLRSAGAKVTGSPKSVCVWGP